VGRHREGKLLAKRDVEGRCPVSADRWRQL